MSYSLLADVIVLLHFLFILFALFGGLLVFRSSRIPWFHIPAVLWAAMIEFSGSVCPLTPLENFFREQGGSITYPTGFIEHYILPLLYPDFLTRKMQVVFGLFVIVINFIIYGLFFYQWKRKSHY